MNKIKVTPSFVMLLVLLFVSVKSLALDYTISFSGTGASTTVGSVIVQNLTKGTSITVPGGNVLNLTDQANGVEQLTLNNEEIRVYPTPEEGKYTLSFYSKNTGATQISAYSIDGRKMAGINTNLQSGDNLFQLLLPKGLYAIRVTGNGYTYATKLVNQIGTGIQAAIQFTGSSNSESSVLQKSKGVASVTMNYTTGDLLLYKGISGNYCTIVTDVPVSSKTTNFDFVECKDANGNYYSVVKIGSQTWMAENLKATKYRNGDDITNLTNNADWGMFTISSWCNYNNDVANVTNFGRLYNWYAISDSRNIAPIGWHVASDSEWTMLTTALGGETLSGGKLKETSLNHWLSPNSSATNETGFTAIPAGSRLTSGQFDNLGNKGNWWSLTENSTNYAWYRYMYTGSASVVRDYYNKNVGFSVRCVKDAALPTISTATPTSISYTTAVGGGNITSDGGAPVTARGVCWSTAANPTLADSKSSDGTSSGTFTSSIMGLTVNTTYYVRAYATNSSGTAYGEQVTFKSLPYDALTVTDADGNLYHSITIGTQIWMVENLKTTKYRNGDIIGTTSSLNMDLTYATSPKYQWAYNGVESNVNTYGRLYTWHAVADPRNLAPAGWHVASDTEWSVLENFLIANSYNYDKTTTGNKTAKSLCSTTLWNTSSTIGTPGYDMTQNNSTGFSMFPGGYRGFDGYFYILGIVSDVWTSTEYSTTNSIIRNLGYNVSSTNPLNSNKNYGFSVRCIKNSVPSLSTNTASSVFSTKVTCGGNITADGGEPVTEYGICWSTSSSPTIADSKKSIGNGTGQFTGSITGLTPNTTYYVRAYATNSIGTAYGSEMSFKTLITDPPTVNDIDGNVYQTVTIGTQTWMAENLKTTKYNDGTKIPLVTDKTTWTYMSTPAYCWYNNDSILYKNNGYGAIYNWYTVNTGKLAPVGWHIPTENEWNELINYLGGNTVAGGKLKQAGFSNWTNPNTGATNETNFNALPSAGRGNNDATFEGIGLISYWWTATQQTSVYSRFVSLGYNNAGVGQSGSQRINGLAVRCIKNTIPVLTTSAPASILSTTALCGGNVTFAGGETVTEFGICWSTSSSPTIADSKKSMGSGTGAFSGSITGLTPNTTYYARAYATNSIGTAYSPEMSFTTLVTDPITVTDVDGNLYHTVTIGTQTWMVENLKTTRYKDGTPISYISYDYDWTITTSGGYGWPNGSITNKDIYGAIYNWYAVGTGKLAPAGWHVATQSDFETLLAYLGGSSVAGGVLKETGTTHWTYGNIGATNSSGFTALPAGYRSSSTGNYQKFGYLSVFWTSTEDTGTSTAARFIMDNTSTTAGLSNNESKLLGFSARCVKD